MRDSGHDHDSLSVRPPSWRFLTSHAQILLAVHRDPEIRMRDLAIEVGVTERRAQEIVSELVAAGFLIRERIGRHNRYSVRADLRVRHPDWGEHNLGDVLSLAAMWTGLRPQGPAGPPGPRGSRTIPAPEVAERAHGGWAAANGSNGSHTEPVELG